MAYDANGEVASQAFRILGTFRATVEAYEKATIYVALDDAQKFFATPGRVTEIVVAGTDLDAASRTAQATQAALGDEVTTGRAWDALEPLVAQMIDVSRSSMGIFYGVFYLAMAFGIANTFLMIVHERTRELGVLLALGVTRGRVMAMLLFEALFVSAIGSVIGGGVGVAINIYYGRVGMDLSFAGQGMEMLGLGSVIHTFITPEELAGAVATTFAISIVVALYPAWKAGRVSPVQAIRMQA
ncbi:MAG: FtsX-like permease family protein [Deltaproteobacteria bacterium]|nr:FtsX-like permease family protein [Deltaproteobacteria bacterium]